MSDDRDILNSKTTPLASSRTIKYAQQLASARASLYTAETTTANQFSPAKRFSNSSASSQATEASDSTLFTPWPRNSTMSRVTTMSSWDFSLTPRASNAVMSTPPRHTDPPPLPNDHVSQPPNIQMTYSTRGSTQAPLPYQTTTSCFVVSNATLSSDNNVSFPGRAKDQNSICHHYGHRDTMQALPSRSTPSLPPQWLTISPPLTHNILALPPPGYVLWVPISQPPGLTFFKPSDTKPKNGDIEAFHVPSDWQYRTAIQREHWVEMKIFQNIPIIRKNHSRWLCGLKKCKWATKGDLRPTIATEYLVHQLETHECWWSRSDEGRIHLNRLKRSLLTS